MGNSLNRLGHVHVDLFFLGHFFFKKYLDSGLQHPACDKTWLGIYIYMLLSQFEGPIPVSWSCLALEWSKGFISNKQV